MDCTWTLWSDWTKCEEKCPVGPNDGKIHRYRTINEHQCGGTACNGTSSESKDCDIVDILRDEIDSCDEGNGHLKSELQACTDKGTPMGYLYHTFCKAIFLIFYVSNARTNILLGVVF